MSSSQANMIQKGNPTGQFIKYLIVGAMNTLVTLAVIFVLKSLADINPYVANAAGYAAGLVNSFLWNRGWVFHSSGKKLHEAVRFSIGFAACYMLQFACVWFLTTRTPLSDVIIEIPLPYGKGIIPEYFSLSGYGIATILAMGVYTVANFLYNRSVTFRR